MYKKETSRQVFELVSDYYSTLLVSAKPCQHALVFQFPIIIFVNRYALSVMAILVSPRFTELSCDTLVMHLALLGSLLIIANNNSILLFWRNIQNVSFRSHTVELSLCLQFSKPFHPSSTDCQCCRQPYFS